MIKSKIKNQRSNILESGVILYLAMLMLSAALTTAIFVSTIFVQEYKISKEVADSLRAVYAADTAMEYTLYQARVDTTFSLFTVVVASDHLKLATGSCEATVYTTSAANKKCDINTYLHVGLGSIPDCPSISAAPDCTHIVAKGSYGVINRAIEITYENL